MSLSLYRSHELSFRTQYAEVKERSRAAGNLLPGTPGRLVLRDGTGYLQGVVAKKEVPGKAEFTSVYKGQRYLFPSAKERAAFDADPATFVGTEFHLGAAPAGNPNAVVVTGKTACAGCAYGVRPITDADSLGMAVVAGETVYVVEGGEKLYPDLFKSRFDGLAVELKGTVKKTQGKFVWVEPTALARTR